MEGVHTDPQIVKQNLVPDVIVGEKGLTGSSSVVEMEEGFQTYWSRRERAGGVRGKGLGRGMGRSYSFD